jgi:hypothetical protein
MKKSFPTILVFAALGGFLTAPAKAAVTSYTSLAAFNAATTGNVAYNFEGIAPINGLVGGGKTVAGVSFSGSVGALVFDANAKNGGGENYANYGVSFFDAQGTPPVTINVGLAGRTALGFYYGSYAQHDTPVTATLSTGNIFTLANTPLAQGVAVNFIGFASDSANITSVAFVTPGFDGVAVLDITGFILANKAVGNVPLPSTMLLMSVSGLLLGKKYRKASALAKGAARADRPAV